MTAGADVDIVVAGTGHNSLIAAAYLTRAGHRCRVLDARPLPGWGVATEELLLPGYLVDSCSTGHTLIETNPLLARDELGLLGAHGLTYLEPDPVAHVVFPDGESLTMWLDLDRTCSGGRCVSVETDAGELHLAREAVLSTIHVKHLVKMAAPECWGEEFLYAIDTFDEGVRTFAAHYATTEAPRYATADGGSVTVVSAGVAGWPEDIVRMGRDVNEGRPVRDGAWLLFPCPTVADPSRAPSGRHTLKVLGWQPYDPGGGSDAWSAGLGEEIAGLHLQHLRRAAPKLTPETILAELVVTPPDLERINPHMWHGTFHGGDRSIAFSGALRPAPGWAAHRMPIPGLYQTGGTTHPGGSVTGGPGRNAAIVLLGDLGHDHAEVMRAARPAGAGRH